MPENVTTAGNTSGPAAAGTPPEKKEDIFESKIFKLFTVALYLGGVSGLGMAISFYLLFFWDSRMPKVPVINPNQAG